MTTTHHPAVERIALSYADVTGMVGLCRRTIEKLVSMGQFPKPRRVVGRVLFDAAEVRRWFSEQPRQGDPGEE